MRTLWRALEHSDGNEPHPAARPSGGRAARR
jgi:hypothetical protein